MPLPLEDMHTQYMDTIQSDTDPRVELLMDGVRQNVNKVEYFAKDAENMATHVLKLVSHVKQKMNIYTEAFGDKGLQEQAANLAKAEYDDGAENSILNMNGMGENAIITLAVIAKQFYDNLRGEQDLKERSEEKLDLSSFRWAVAESSRNYVAPRPEQQDVVICTVDQSVGFETPIVASVMSAGFL